MLKRLKIISSSLATAMLLVFVRAQRVFAEGQTVGVGLSKDTIVHDQAYTYTEYIKGLYAYSMKAAVALSILMLIYAGYKYMTSRGDSGAINEAKDILFSTLMGAALLMLVVLAGSLGGVDIQVR